MPAGVRGGIQGTTYRGTPCFSSPAGFPFAPGSLSSSRSHCVAAGTSPRAAAVPEKGTEILWDTYGIPHIFAPDHPSLFYAYGYAQMEAHAELLVRLYAQARGRGAEFYGDAYLASDRWVRTNGIPQKAKQWAAQQSAGVRPADPRVCGRPERVGGEESRRCSAPRPSACCR